MTQRVSMGALALAAAVFLVQCSSPSDSVSGTGSDSGTSRSRDAGARGSRDSSARVDAETHKGSDSGRGAETSSDSGSSSVATRPTYNTGDGFFVLNGKLYDANGHEFMIRGVDRCHYDSGSLPAMSYSKANAVRTFVGINYGQTWSGLANIIQTQNIAYDEVPVIAAPSTTTGTGTSCSSDPTVLSDVVANSWVASASTWTAFNKNSIYNIANEWGPSNSTVWRDSYVTAISQMRGAGYLGPLMIDAGGCGQDEADLAQYAAAVFMSDPQRNVIFSYHMYGGTNDESAAIRAVLTGMERGIRNG